MILQRHNLGLPGTPGGSHPFKFLRPVSNRTYSTEKPAAVGRNLPLHRISGVPLSGTPVQSRLIIIPYNPRFCKDFSKFFQNFSGAPRLCPSCQKRGGNPPLFLGKTHRFHLAALLFPWGGSAARRHTAVWYCFKRSEKEGCLLAEVSRGRNFSKMHRQPSALAAW